MKTILLIALSSVALLVTGCAIGISRTGYALPNNQETKNLTRRPIAIQLGAKYDTNDIVILGSIRAYETGFSENCDEAAVLDIFCKEGNMLDADIVNITEESQPSLWSTCYRANATFLKLKDREKAKTLVSDARYTQDLIVERSVKSGKRNRDAIIGGIVAGPLGAVIVWSATSPDMPPPPQTTPAFKRNH